MKFVLYLQEETNGTVADVEDGECLSDGESESQVRYPAPPPYRGKLEEIRIDFLHQFYCMVWYLTVLRIRIGMIRTYVFGLLAPDPLVRGTDPDSGSFYQQAKIVSKSLDSYCFVTSLCLYF